MQVTVHYFAILRELAGIQEETIDTTAETASDLFWELAERHGFSPDQDRMRVVVNENFESWSHRLNAGDTVAFIPPVAGG